MVAKFLPYLKAHRWQVAWALAQVFLITGFELLKPWPLQIVIDYVLGGNSPAIGGPIGALLSLPPPVLLVVACAGEIAVQNQPERSILVQAMSLERSILT